MCLKFETVACPWPLTKFDLSWISRLLNLRGEVRLNEVRGGLGLDGGRPPFSRQRATPFIVGWFSGRIFNNKWCGIPNCLNCRNSIVCTRFPTRWHSWLRHCATSRKVACSIPDGVIGIFHGHNLSGRTMALGFAQSLAEMSTRNISWRGGGKGGRCIGLTTLPSSCADCLEIWEPQPWNSQGLSRPVKGLLYIHGPRARTWKAAGWRPLAWMIRARTERVNRIWTGICDVSERTDYLCVCMVCVCVCVCVRHILVTDA